MTLTQVASVPLEELLALPPAAGTFWLAPRARFAGIS